MPQANVAESAGSSVEVIAPVPCLQCGSPTTLLEVEIEQSNVALTCANAHADGTDVGCMFELEDPLDDLRTPYVLTALRSLTGADADQVAEGLVAALLFAESAVA